MPSGAKKRKAAKKKKENQSNGDSKAASASAQSHGDEDVKEIDDKECDAADVRSSASRDQHSHQNLSMEWKEEVVEKFSNFPSAEGSRIDGGEKEIEVEEGFVWGERKFKIEDGTVHRDERIEHDEAVRKYYDGGSAGRSGSSSSSSDDEDHVRNSQAAVGVASLVDSLNVAGSLSGRSDEAIHKAPNRESVDSIVENVPVADLKKITELGKPVEVDVGSPADNSVAPFVVESVPTKNEGKKIICVEEKFDTSVSLTNAALEREDEATVHPIKNTATFYDRNEYATHENDERLSAPCNAPRATADNGAEHDQDSGVAEPLLVPSPCPAPKTSWTSCCGLFELFSGSGT